MRSSRWCGHSEHSPDFGEHFASNFEHLKAFWSRYNEIWKFHFLTGFHLFFRWRSKNEPPLSWCVCWMEFGLIPVIPEPIPFFKRQCSPKFISSFLCCNKVCTPFQRNCVPASISSFPNKFLIASHRKVEISDTELTTGTDSSELKQDPSNREPKKKSLFSP